MATHHTSRRSPELSRLADAVLQPGFVGTTPPDWIRRRLAAGLGGVALFARNIAHSDQLAALTATLRAENPNVIIGIDEEGGDVTRLEARRGSSRPGNLALGVVDDLALTEEVARDIGRDLAAAGVTLDYAPDADVNSNPNNPVIGVRSFGSDTDLVAQHTAAWVRGLQSTGVAACAKHFPGHGDTSVDSHHDLPTLTGSAEYLARVALPPFRAAVDAGAVAVMTGHLHVPALDADLPATMSRVILVDLLRTELRFDGLVISDGIEMNAVAGRYGMGGAAVRAVAGGADAVCVGGGHAEEATADLLRDALVDAVLDGRLTEERLARAARRVEQAAAWIGARAATRAAAGQTGGAPDQPVSPGLRAARRAVRVTAGTDPAALPLRAAAHVVEFTPATNPAIGTETLWGVAEPLTALLPGTTSVRLARKRVDGRDWLDTTLEAAAGRPLVAVGRDAHRHPWLVTALSRLLARRPDAVVVEMGVPTATVTGAVRVATYGAARVCGQAAAEVLAGA